MMADIVVLAEDTPEVAPGEKYRAGAAVTDENAFFAEVRPDGTDYRHFANSAKANFAFAAVDFTPPRAKDARPHHPQQLLRRFAERIDINW
jgi:hypothetical protein